MKKKLLVVILIVAALSIWIFASLHSKARPYEPEAITVSVQTIKEAALPSEVHAIGTVVAKSVDITPDLSGHVQKILFQDGTFVKKDTPLIQLDDAIYQAKFASAKADLIFSENKYKRILLLGNKGIIAKQGVDQAENDFKQKKAAADEAEATLNQTLLKAPFDGVVGKAKVNPGDYVNSTQSVVTITDTRHLRVEYNVPEKYLPLLKLGQTVRITSATYPGKIFFGKLAFISPTINIDSRAISLYAETTNSDNLLAAGMFVEVIQILGTDEHVLMIPARSLVPMLDGEQIYKIVNGKALAANIVIGKRLEENVQVVEGLSVGDVVITDGQLKVKNGTPVKIKIES